MKRVWRLACVSLALALAACAGPRTGAPVFERSPGRQAAAPVQPAPGVQQTPVPQADGEPVYTVKRGDTLYSIALEHGADYREMAQWNSLDDPTKLRVGQQLRTRAPEGRAGVQVGPARAAGRVEARPLETQPVARVEPQLIKTEPKLEPARTEPAPTRTEPAESAEFIWPAKGKVLVGFSEPRSKGIDIDGKVGDPVVAAAAGRVTYIGSGIPGLGKLVVIKHDNGFITVYAHNKEILVKEQQSVARGQRIAELGSSDAERPKLHFQIRKGAAAVDPLRYLPAS
jgi:lipoprotein NlpD